MGGMGALTLYLKSLGSASEYRSASAFAPISNPVKAPWGEKAYAGYLAGGVDEGKAWDPTELIKGLSGKDLNVLVDAGTGDDFYKKAQILPENLQAAATAAGFGQDKVRINLREGYDHSYYFISSFVSFFFAWFPTRRAGQEQVNADPRPSPDCVARRRPGRRPREVPRKVAERLSRGTAMPL